jgi:cell division protein FtsQ
MQTEEYNAPNTRARIAALRQSRKQLGASSRLSSKAYRAARVAYTIGEAIRNPMLKTQTSTFRRRAMRSRMAVSPTYRNRANQRNKRRQGSQVKPSIQRVVLDWVVTGRLVSLVIFIVCIGVAVYLFTSPRFTVQEVVIEGNVFLPENRIRTLAHLAGTSIWFINYAEVEQRLQQNSYIEQVRFHTSLPNRVTVSITERQPDVYWRVGMTNYVVDTTGTVLDVAKTLPTSTTLVIEDSTHQLLQPHDRVDVDAIRLAHTLASRLPDEAHLQPAVIGWDYGLGVYIKTATGQLIIFGQYQDIERKIAILAHMLQAETAFTYLDLRPAKPFYQNKPLAAQEGAAQYDQGDGTQDEGAERDQLDQTDQTDQTETSTGQNEGQDEQGHGR